MADVKTFDFKQVAVIVGGVPMTNFAEGDDVISIEFSKEAYELKMGADGEPTRSKSNDNSAKITLKLMKSSDSNDVLNGFYQADKLSNGGIVSILISDKSGRESHFADKVWIQKGPNAGLGMNVSTREWVLVTGELTSTYGGN